MDRVSVEQRCEIAKTSTDRLRARLMQVGYNDVTVMAYDRHELMAAEYMLLVRPPVEPARGAVGGVDVLAEENVPAEVNVPAEDNVLGEAEVEAVPDVAEAGEMTEMEFRRRELRLREMELERQREKEKKD